MAKNSKGNGIDILGIVILILIVLVSLFLHRAPEVFQDKKSTHKQTESPALANWKNMLPASERKGQVIHHFAYSISYIEDAEQPEWVAYRLTHQYVKGKFRRSDNFREDKSVNTGSAKLKDYASSGYDRGHLAPAGDMKWSEKAMSESFFMSNMTPQKAGFNRGIWRELEEQVRDWALLERELFIITGPVLNEGLSSIGESKVSIPEYYYKVILDIHPPEYKAIGFLLKNQRGKNPLPYYAFTVDSIEAFSGIDFFPAMEDSLEYVLEGNIEIDRWFSLP